MALNPGRAEQERMAAAAASRRTTVARRERRLETLFGAGFLGAAFVLWLLAGASGEVHVLPALVCMACLAVAVHVPFAVGDGYTVPTQLAFVPLVVTVPLPLRPEAVVRARIGARFPAEVLPRWPPSRILLVPGDAWFAVGPAVVLAL